MSPYTHFTVPYYFLALNCEMFVLQVEEFVALTDPRLSLFSGEEEQFDSYNDRPQHKITNFRYYTLDIVKHTVNICGGQTREPC